MDDRSTKRSYEKNKQDILSNHRQLGEVLNRIRRVKTAADQDPHFSRRKETLMSKATKNALIEIARQMKERPPDLDPVTAGAVHHYELCRSLIDAYPVQFSPIEDELQALHKELEQKLLASGKTNGRIELEEIEIVLARHEAVRKCALLAREDTPGDVRLVAYVTRTGETAPPTSELRDFLSETLPDHMLPGAFVFLNELPLLPNGKLDRAALPIPDAGRPRLRTEFVAPRSPLEEVMAAIWASVLDAEMVGVHDSFFELGGHSLLVMRLIAQIRDVLHVQLPLATVFDAPTVAGVTKAIAADPEKRERAEEATRLQLRGAAG